jgi:hypothetical protein
VIAFCITCRGRAAHLKRTLPQNLADNPRARFIVLDYSSDDDLMEYLSSLTSARLSVYQYPGQKLFRMAHAKNMVHRCALLEGADILVNLDADNTTAAGFEDYIEGIVTPFDYLATGPIVPGRRGVSGRIALHRYTFLNVGGYDERFDTWAPDDKDLNHRLQRMGYWAHIIPDKYLHCIKHGDGLRFRDYPHVRGCDPLAYEEAVSLGTTTVVNSGNIGCGLIYRYRRRA